MGFIRKALIIILIPLFCVLLILAAVDAGLVLTASQASQIKHIVASSGIYKQVIPDVLSQAQTISSDSGTIPLNSPAIKAAANTAFSPSFIQSSTNQAIDSVYGWLNGKTPQPDFKIDLSANKARFATLAGQAATARASSLPACTSLVDLSNYDVFTATCLPRGLTSTVVGANTQNIFQSGKGFIDNPVISANTIKSSGSNSSIFAKQLKQMPKMFRWAKASPWILAGLAILSGVGIYFLARGRRAALKYVAICLVVAGMITLLVAAALAYIVHSQVPKISFGGQPQLNSSVQSAITKLAQAIDKNYWWLGGIYAGLGLAGIGTLIYKRQPAYKTAKPSQREPEDDLPPPRKKS